MIPFASPAGLRYLLPVRTPFFSRGSCQLTFRDVSRISLKLRCPTGPGTGQTNNPTTQRVTTEETFPLISQENKIKGKLQVVDNSQGPHSGVGCKDDCRKHSQGGIKDLQRVHSSPATKNQPPQLRRRQIPPRVEDDVYTMLAGDSEICEPSSMDRHMTHTYEAALY